MDGPADGRVFLTIRIEHVALWVRDLEGMRAFYVDHLGGRSGARYENPRKGFRSYFITFGEGARLELMTRTGVETAPPAESLGWAHVALSVGSRAAVDALISEMESRGVAVESRPRVTGDGYYEAVIRDPEGNRIEITG